jgi:outer membrane immunogenic protein
MRRLALALLATAAFTQFASAADLPVKAYTKAPALVAAPYNWTGCYVGGNSGWIGGLSRSDLAPSGNYLNAPGAAAPPNAAGTGDFPASIAALSNSYRGNGSGVEIGAQIGCNWQSGAWVYGGELDGQWSSLRDTSDATFAAFANPGNPAFTNAAHTEHVSNGLDWFSTLKGRFGYAWDRWMIYGTGGLAFGGGRSETNVSFATLGGLSVYSGAVHSGSANFTRAGWALGAGFEYAFSGPWSLKAEYLYVDLGRFSYNSPLVASAAPAAPGYSWSTTVRERAQLVRLGVNYRFQ